MVDRILSCSNDVVLRALLLAIRNLADSFVRNRVDAWKDREQGILQLTQVSHAFGSSDCYGPLQKHSSRLATEFARLTSITDRYNATCTNAWEHNTARMNRAEAHEYCLIKLQVTQYDYVFQTKRILRQTQLKIQTLEASRSTRADTSTNRLQRASFCTVNRVGYYTAPGNSWMLQSGQDERLYRYIAGGGDLRLFKRDSFG